MNEFYLIFEDNGIAKDDLMLDDMGNRKPLMTVGFPSRRSDFGGGSRGYNSKTYYGTVTADDYDNQFVNKLIKYKPIYNIHLLLDYHFKHYSKKYGNEVEEKFLKHMKYVVLPKLKTHAKARHEYVELFEEWLENNGLSISSKVKNITNNIRTGDINAPTQFQQNSSKSKQLQKISIDPMEIRELLKVIKQDIQPLEGDLRNDIYDEVEKAQKHLDAGKDISTRLLTIGELMKDIGINVFANLLASPIYEMTKPLLGL